MYKPNQIPRYTYWELLLIVVLGSVCLLGSVLLAVLVYIKDLTVQEPRLIFICLLVIAGVMMGVDVISNVGPVVAR